MHYNTILNKMDYYETLYSSEPNSVDVIKYATNYATNIVNDPSIQEQLATKGAAGKYVIGRYVTWAEEVLKKQLKIALLASDSLYLVSEYFECMHYAIPVKSSKCTHCLQP